MKPFIDTVDISVRYKPLTPKPFAPKTGETALRKYLNKSHIFKRNSQSKIYLQPSLKKKLRQRFLTQEKNPFKRKYLTPLLRAADDEERVQAYRNQLLRKKYNTENIDPRLLRMDSEIDDFMKQYKIPEPNKLFSLPEHIEPQIDYGKASDLLQKFGKDVFVTTDERPPALVDTYYESLFKKTPEVPPNTPFVLEKTETTDPEDVVKELKRLLEKTATTPSIPEDVVIDLKAPISRTEFKILPPLPVTRTIKQILPPGKEFSPVEKANLSTEVLKQLATEIDQRLDSGQYKNKRKLEFDIADLALTVQAKLPQPSITKKDFFHWWYENTRNKDNPVAMNDLRDLIRKYFGKNKKW